MLMAPIQVCTSTWRRLVQQGRRSPASTADSNYIRFTLSHGLSVGGFVPTGMGWCRGLGQGRRNGKRPVPLLPRQVCRAMLWGDVRARECSKRSQTRDAGPMGVGDSPWPSPTFKWSSNRSPSVLRVPKETSNWSGGSPVASTTVRAVTQPSASSATAHGHRMVWARGGRGCFVVVPTKREKAVG